MKIISFNVNSLRTRLHQLEALVERYQPDFIGLQETKVTDDEFPTKAIQALGYHVEYTGQKTHYGVALLSKHPFIHVCKNLEAPQQDEQKRFISGEFLVNNRRVFVINGYFPQGESRDHPQKFPNKKLYYQNLLKYLQHHHSPEDALLVIGDMNVAPQNADIGLGEDAHKRWLRSGKCSFLPEERQWLQSLCDWGLTDPFPATNINIDEAHSWFDYRTRAFDREPKRGLRIDLILATANLAQKCQRSGIDYDIRAMEKPSDHCPVWAEFDV